MSGTHAPFIPSGSSPAIFNDLRERYSALIAISDNGAWEWDADADFLRCSSAYFSMLGREIDDYDLSGRPNLEATWIELLHPDDRARAVSAFSDYLAAGSPGIYECHFRLRHADGHWVWVRSRGKTLRDAEGRPSAKTLGTHIDISDRKRTERREQQRRFVLEKIAGGGPLAETLAAIVAIIEEESRGALGSILLLDPTGKLLHFGAAPSLPDSYNCLTHGMPIGPEVGSCGAAAFTGRRIIVEDIATHPCWAPFKDHALAAGLGSCWSEPILSAKGAVIGTFAIYRATRGGPATGDIDLIRFAAETAALAIERHRSDSELRLMGERLRIATTSASIGVWDWDVAADTVVWDDTMYRIWHTTRSEYPDPNRLRLERIHPDDLLRLNALRDAAIRTGSAYDPEFRIVIPHLGTRLLRSSSHTLYDSSGRVSRILGVNIDITDERHTRDELRALNTTLESRIAERTAELREATHEAEALGERLLMILDATPEGIFGVDSTGRCTFHNRAALRLLGIPESDNILGCDMRLHAHPTHQPGDDTPCSILLALAGGQSCHNADTTFRRADGTTFPTAYWSYPHLSDNIPCGAIVTFHDLTSQRRAENELREAKTRAEQANRAKGDFLATMSHEIRTPLNAILGYTELMLRESDLRREQLIRLQTISGAGHHLLALINDILEISKIEAGKITRNDSPFNLRTLLAELTALYAENARAKGITLDLVIRPEVPAHVLTDQAKLRQALLNLIGNAVKFTSSGGVTLAARMEPLDATGDLRLAVAITDSGPGIPPAEIKKLFRVFVQSAAGLASGGTGLGLAISKQYAVLLGGDITVTSTPGTGTTFTLTTTLRRPDDDAHATPAPPRPIPLRLAADQPPVRVLVVDDVPVNLHLFHAILTPLGFDVHTATNGLESIAAFDDWRPHVILMDMRMPLMDGNEAIRRIRGCPGGDAPTILSVTASAFDEDRDAALAAGADGLLHKPFKQAELFATLGDRMGLRYVFPDTPEANARPAPHAAELLPLAIPDPALRREFLAAAAAADFDLLLTLADRLATTGAPDTDRLRRLVRAYDYDTLARLIAAPGI